MRRGNYFYNQNTCRAKLLKMNRAVGKEAFIRLSLHPDMPEEIEK